MNQTYIIGAMIGAFLLFVGGVASTVILWRQQTPGSEEDRQIARLRRQTEREERRRLKEVRKIAKQLRKQVIQELARMGYSWKYSEQLIPKRKVSKPDIKNILYTQHAIYYRLDRLPFRVTFADLLNPANAVERNLAYAIGREVKLLESTEHGVWVMIGLKTGVAAVPKFFAWYDKANATNAVELLPSTRPFTIALGAGENGRFVYQDFTEFPHLLVAGSTGGGKSVFMRQMLCSLITRNRPEHLQVMLIDLKGGLEFWPFKEIPHLRRPVVIDPGQVEEALDEVITEKERRFALLRNANVNDIRLWNASRADKLPYLLIVFDEIAALMLNNKLKKGVERLVENIAAQGRALGIHMVLCTQIPNKLVVSTIIKGNITSRVAFVTDPIGSMLILGNHHAANLPPGGRAVYMHANSQTELQAPFIEDEQVKDAIERAGNPEKPTTITDQDIFMVALHNLEGRFVRAELTEALAGQVSQYRVEKVGKTWQYSEANKGPVIELDSGRYLLSPPMKLPQGGRLGRRLVPVNGEMPTQERLQEIVLEMETANSKRHVENGQHAHTENQEE
jgi:hypothetical protein